MTQLFRRTADIVVQDLRLTGLRVQFSITKTLRRAPNEGTIRVSNINEENRRRLQQLDRVRVRLEVGYQGEHAVLLDADIRNVESTPDGADIVTKFTADDGGHAQRTSRVNRSFGANARLEDVVGHVAQSMAVGVGNAIEAVRSRGFEGLSQVFTGGTVTSGRAVDELDRLADSAGLEWSVQDGHLQLLERGRALRDTAVRLTPDTGLIGSPTAGPNNVVKVNCLLIPDVFPGRKVQVESDFVTGTYRVEKAEYKGDTHGSDWGLELECREPRA